MAFKNKQILMKVCECWKKTWLSYHIRNTRCLNVLDRQAIWVMIYISSQRTLWLKSKIWEMHSNRRKTKRRSWARSSRGWKKRQNFLKGIRRNKKREKNNFINTRDSCASWSKLSGVVLLKKRRLSSQQKLNFKGFEESMMSFLN